jgi:hypothetical protein
MSSVGENFVVSMPSIEKGEEDPEGGVDFLPLWWAAWTVLWSLLALNFPAKVPIPQEGACKHKGFESQVKS